MNLDKRLPELLLSWYAENHRALPWRQDNEPYHVWLSEIMLQQTRVEAVKEYYTRFLRELPTISALASCEEDRLQKLWEGLGYYSRVRNLQKAAKTIMQEHQGAFPQSYDAVRALSGIGDYTAGAICSICFDAPTPAVDGNVLRVLSRVTEDSADILAQRTKRQYNDALAEIYPQGRCGDFTQSLMELGATVCVPNGAPKCEACPLQGICKAYAHKTQAQYPVKAAKKAKRMEEKTVFLLRFEDTCAVRKRPAKGLLAGLWELPNVEGHLDAQEALSLAEQWGVHPQELLRCTNRTHIFTHIIWQMRCYEITCRVQADTFVWADKTRFSRDVALPTAFRMFLEA